MTDIDQEIQNRIQAFVDELSTLVRQAALASVAEALGAERAAAPAPRGRPAARAAAPARARGRRPKGQKRSPAELKRLVESVQSYVQKSPGRGVEQMSRDLGVPSKELTLPIRKLVKQRLVKTRGQKRATKYYPGGGGGGGGRRRAAKA